jgi:hypothetical protein
LSKNLAGCEENPGFASSASANNMSKSLQNNNAMGIMGGTYLDHGWLAEAWWRWDSGGGRFARNSRLPVYPWPAWQYGNECGIFTHTLNQDAISKRYLDCLGYFAPKFPGVSLDSLNLISQK